MTATRRALLVLAAATPLLVQDLGRPGLAALGVGTSGAADRGALQLANRLVANPPGAAGLEVLLGGAALESGAHLTVAVTGANVPLRLAGRAVPGAAPLAMSPGDVLELGSAHSGLRAYVAVRGGIDSPPVLGSRSHDTLGRLGPPPVVVGTVLSIGPPPEGFPQVDLAVTPNVASRSLRVLAGPRDDWLAAGAFEALLRGPWRVDPASSRVGLRLAGPPLRWRSPGRELPSEGMIRGGIQVPPSGLPVVLGPDHPITGGYPVLAVVRDADVDACAQYRPGDLLVFSTK